MSAQTGSVGRTPRRAATDSPLLALDKAVKAARGGIGVEVRHDLTLAEIFDTESLVRLVRATMGRPQYWQLAEIAMGRPHANIDPVVAVFTEPPKTIWERFARIAAAAITLRMQELAQRTPIHGSACLTYDNVGGQAQWTSERCEYDIYLGVMRIDVNDTLFVPTGDDAYDSPEQKDWYVDLWSRNDGAVMVYYGGNLADYGFLFLPPSPVTPKDITDNKFLVEARRRFVDRDYRPAQAPAFTA
jgi:hypothetical protein